MVRICENAQTPISDLTKVRKGLGRKLRRLPHRATPKHALKKCFVSARWLIHWRSSHTGRSHPTFKSRCTNPWLCMWSTPCRI